MSKLRDLINKRLKLVLFIIFSCGVLAGSLTFFTISLGKPLMGVVISEKNNVWSVSTVDGGGLADAAGIKVGDIPLEINNEPASDFLSTYEKVGTVWGPLIRELKVTDKSNGVKEATTAHATIPAETTAELSTWFVVCFIFWLTGFYVYFKKPKNPAAFLLCLCSLIIGMVFSADMAANRGIPTAVYFEVSASIFGPWVLTHFFLILPDEQRLINRDRHYYFLYILPAITLTLFFFIGYVNGQPVPWFRSLRLFEYALGFLTAGIVAVLNYTMSHSVKTRQQMKVLLMGCLAALIPLLILNIIPQAIWSQPLIPPRFSILLIVFIPIAMGYAIVTTRILDIDIFIRRSLIYGLITILMGLVLSAVVLIPVIGHTALGIPEDILLALVLGGIAAALFGPVKQAITSQVDRLFYKDRYDYRQIIQSLTLSLNKLNTANDVSRIVVGTVVNTLNLGGGCLFTGSRETLDISAAQGTFTDKETQNRLIAAITHREPLHEFPNSAANIAPWLAFIIPIISGGKEAGVLCISPKNSRQAFSSGDIYLLQGVASVAASALHSALLVRDVSLRDTFVSVASHELRTPLTSIVGYADLLMRRDPTPETKKRWIQNILTNGQKISKMVDDLLNITRIQSGRVNIKLEEVPIPDIIDETLSVIGEENNGSHRIVTEISSNIPRILVDHDKFSQVIINLVNNALKYSPNGGRVTVSAREDRDKRRVVVCVSDEGIGIAPEDKSLLFTTFHRIQRPETRGIRGSGLGLYIAKEWTTAMGGEIWLESELNRGSSFFVSVPAKIENSDTENNGKSNKEDSNRR